MNKNEKLLKEFTSYCEANPEFRFWQALRNWNQIENPEENFILAGECDPEFPITKFSPWNEKTLDDTFNR